MSRHNLLSAIDEIITPHSTQPLHTPAVRKNSNFKESHTKENLLLEAVERDIENEDFTLLLYFLETAEEQQILENEKVAKDIASSVMQLIFHSQKEDKMLRKIFLSDIDQCMDLNIAFRETNLSILSLKILFKLYKGEKCFINLLRPALASLLMLDDNSDAEQVGHNLISACNDILDSIMTKLDKISTRPKNNAFAYFIKGFGSIFALFSQLLNDLKISRDRIIQLLTSIFFLRFISPMICLPKEHGLLKQPLELAQQVRFVYLTKLIQAIANNQKDQKIITSLPKKFFRSYIKKSHSKVQSIVEMIINESTKLSGNERVELPRRYREEKCFSILQSFFNEHNQKVPENIWFPKTYSPFIHPPISTSPIRTSLSDCNLLKNCSNSVLNYTEYEELFKKEIRDHQTRVYGFALAPLEPHSIIPPLYGTLWSLQYEIAAVNWKVDRKSKEVIQAAVSVINQCDFCADMHTTAAMSLGMSFRSVDALIHGKQLPKHAGDIPNNLVLMVQWAAISNQKGHAGLVSPPFPADEAPEIMAAATLKHYFNRITNTFVKFFTRAKGSFWKSKVFQKKAQDAKINTSFSIPPLYTQSLPFAAALSTHSITDLPSVESYFPHLLLYNDQSTEYPAPVSPRLSGFISLTMNTSEISPLSTLINRNSAGSLYNISSSPDVKEEKGSSSLPHTSFEDFMKNIMAKKGGWEEKLSDSFAWAKSNPIISEILCRWQLLEEQLARECLSPSVIEKLHNAVDEWNGSSVFTPQQLNDFIADLTPAEQIMAKLVITIAQNPKKVSSHLTNQFLSLYPPSVAPQFLIGACSYAAFYATKHIASFWSINSSHNLQRLLSSGRL